MEWPRPRSWPGDKVVLLADQDENSYLAAFSKSDGELLWKKGRIDLGGGFATPVVHRVDGSGMRVLTSGPREVAAYSLEDGKRHWWVGGMPFQPLQMPVIGQDSVFVLARGVMDTMPSYESFLAFVDLNKDGKLTIEDFPLEAGGPRSFEKMDINGNGWVQEDEYSTMSELVQGGSVLMTVKLGGRRRSHGSERLALQALPAGGVLAALLQGPPLSLQEWRHRDHSRPVIVSRLSWNRRKAFRR